MDNHVADLTRPTPDQTFAPTTSLPLGDWTVEAVWAPEGQRPPLPAPLASGVALPATVPGCVHTDLLPHGLVSDITIDGSEARDAWVMRTGWRYRTRVEVPGFADLPETPAGAPEQAPDGEGPRFPRRAVLEFGGIDTVATVRVNGRDRLTTTDMFRRHEVDVTEELAAGPLDLEVEILPAIELAEERERENPLPRPGMYAIPYNQVRKMACSYGWDWGPITGTAGIWRPVTLHVWAGARFSDLRVTATAGEEPVVVVAASIDGSNATVDGTSVSVEIAGPDALHVSASAEVTDEGQGTPDVTGQALLRVPVPGARTWHPVGDGDQPLYTVTVRLSDAAGAVLQESTRRVGFRRVDLVQADDAHGRSFELHVNGARLWVRGLNWIPDDPYPSRITRDRLRTRIQQAVDTGANLLRVWGGGIFESEDFYDLCDELGVLVLQDFLFACAAYPEDEATVADVTAEVSDNVARLRHRASLVLWSGCNENLWGYEDWGWQEALDGRPWGARYYAEVLPEVLAQLDGQRPYVPGSPFSPGGLPERTDGPIVDDETRGTVHIWDVWNSRDYEDYETKRPRFAAEFGYQAPASWPTLATAVGATDLGPAAFGAEDPRLEVHQKAESGSAKLRAGLERHLAAPPTDGPGWYFATQLLQARAVRFGIGHLRSLHETCSGTIWWQHNDMWPVISWAIVDSAGRRKLAWYAMRESYRPRDVFVGPAEAGPGGPLLVTAVNDTAEPWSAPVVVRVLGADGAVLAEGTAQLDAPARGSARATVAAALAGAPGAATGRLPAGAVAVVVDGPDWIRTARWTVPDPQLQLPEPDLQIRAVAAGADEVAVEVTTSGLVRDLCLLAELAVPDAVVGTQLLTLLPGEQAVFRVSGPGVADVPVEQWSSLLWHDARLG